MTDRISGVKPDGALVGPLVLDASRVVVKPFASKLLGDYGAEGIKAERLTGMIRAIGAITREVIACIGLDADRIATLSYSSVVRWWN